jgi:hypothetical protein
MTQEVDTQKRKGQMQMWIKYESRCAQIEDLMLSGSGDKFTEMFLEQNARALVWQVDSPP